MKMRTASLYVRRKGSGRTLVELMIALSLGLFVMLGITSLFAANKKSFTVADDKGRLEEEGRLALNLMAYHVRMAGYGSLTTPKESYTDDQNGNKQVAALFTNFGNQSTGASENAIRGCAGGFADPSKDVSSIACVAGTTSDAFLVRYVVDQDTVTSGSATATDCLGAAVQLSPAIPESPGRAASPAFYLIENRFYVAN